MEALEQEIYELAGHPLNIASPKQLQQVLFEELGLPVVKKTKTGPSTDADVLEELAAVHPLPAKIIEYRQYAKLKSTYVDALPEMVHPDDRPRARLVQPGSGGHRAAQLQRPEPAEHPGPDGRGPRDPLGVRARRAGLAAPGRRLLADRAARAGPFLAATSGSPRPSPATRTSTPGWPARSTASRWTRSRREMRREAKAVNFGVIYGQSAVRAGQAVGDRAGGGGGVHRHLF